MSDPATSVGAKVGATDPTSVLTVEAPSLPSGARLGSFRIIERIGRGGMGDVYRAHDDELDRDVAVKTISKALSADPSFVVRFKEEARAAAKLSHGNIVQVHAAGETEGTLY